MRFYYLSNGHQGCAVNIELMEHGRRGERSLNAELYERKYDTLSDGTVRIPNGYVFTFLSIKISAN